MISLQGLPSTQRLDDLARLVKVATGADAALISMVDATGQRILGQAGLPEPWCTTRTMPPELSFCRDVTSARAPLVIADAPCDLRFATRPAVHVRGLAAYLGVPVWAADGALLGVVSACQSRPRTWTEDDRTALDLVVESIGGKLRDRQLFDAHPQPLWIFDRATLRFLMVNDASVAKYGYSRDEFLGMTLRDIRPPEDVPALEARVGQLTGSLSEPTLWRHRLKSGEMILVEISSSEIRLDGVSARLSVGVDVTERTRARQEVSAAKQRYEDAMDASQACFSEYDLARDAFTFDRGAVEMLGFKLTELGREGFLARVHPDDVEQFLRGRLRIAEMVEPAELTFRFLDAWERLRWLRLVLRPVAGPGGAATGAFCGITDVTELVEARRVAERALKQQTDFLASISHELRTPLNGILGMGQILRMVETDPGKLAYLDVIEASGAALLAQIEQLLELSQMAEGEPVFRLEHYDPVAVAGQALSAVRFAAMAKGLALRIEADAGPRFAYGDPLRLRQILVTLLENAVKFTETGGVTVEIPAADRLTLRLIVRDTGIGIPEALRPLIFEVFTRGDGAGRPPLGGMGVGLAIVRHILAAMGGAITVDSGPHGSAFAVDLPMVALRTAGADALRA